MDPSLSRTIDISFVLLLLRRKPISAGVILPNSTPLMAMILSLTRIWSFMGLDRSKLRTKVGPSPVLSTTRPRCPDGAMILNLVVEAAAAGGGGSRETSGTGSEGTDWYAPLVIPPMLPSPPSCISTIRCDTAAALARLPDDDVMISSICDAAPVGRGGGRTRFPDDCVIISPFCSFCGNADMGGGGARATRTSARTFTPTTLTPQSLVLISFTSVPYSHSPSSMVPAASSFLIVPSPCGNCDSRSICPVYKVFPRGSPLLASSKNSMPHTNCSSFL
mmetsp:Transcript_23358/g.41897  ORF Transcript_23358/g.41897 Transcript_23358/m.41897 type:complete len:277 (-) Transcript_23358:3752-4582(-)